MSANDNAMTRFLFAILRQKCLKDIDWNKVAHDPILAQEITNGHAARMRYSRFRSAMLGLEPQRRNRTNPNKSRVSKSKKDGKSGGSAKKEESVKDEMATSPDTKHRAREDRKAPLSPVSSGSPTVKAESAHHPAEHAFDYGSSSSIAPTPPMGTVALSDTQLHPRLMTPCSDTDFLGTASTYAGSPAASDLLPSDMSFDFSAEAPAWATADAYAPFSMGYDINALSMGMCEHHPPAHGGHHHHHHHGQQEELCIRPAAMMEPDMGDQLLADVVKHEEWATQSYQ